MQNFSQRVVSCINAQLHFLKLRGQIVALYHVTPELITSIAENYFDSSIKRICDFLNDRLTAEMNLPKYTRREDKLLSHLSDEEYKRGDLFTVISVAEIVYSLQRKNSMPAFPVMSPEICEILKRKHDLNSAHGNFLRKQMGQQGGCDVAKSCVETHRLSDSPDRQVTDDKLVEFKKEMFEHFLLPIIQQYYMHYQTDQQIKYTIFRLQQKLNHLIDQSIHNRKQEFAEYKRQLEFSIKQQFNYALKIEKRNLRDEAKWRDDERENRRKEASKLAAGVQTRRLNEINEKNEKEEERRQLLNNLREEEIKYCNYRRKESEEEVFKHISNISANYAVGKINVKNMSKVLKYTEKDVVERLRLYQGAEQIYSEGGKDRMARSSYQ
ncbi:hypothetical protein SS50377_20855 [Spironucleus salmonicida]|uniref:Uncharacterized protein n=1 Tax=Spironucleus salmonicida TaxID=348837 RepID=V6LGU9_9EUKA|nr:hypothetical protein SS50377_20855 [Spironucleus salmonicida]|eukprot:EST43533.1 hypothetical protein SS50377_16568 [Spironucleus salmonicida]